VHALMHGDQGLLDDPLDDFEDDEEEL
jgi:hypothetical protein